MKEGPWARVRAGACPPGELWAQQAELQALGQLSVGKTEADEGTAFPQRCLQLQGTRGTKRVVLASTERARCLKRKGVMGLGAMGGKGGWRGAEDSTNES